MPNRLADETSPYLRQHADNPVDWWPFGDEAFELARRTDRPVLISVGYSSCHWCHVMAHESFEDPDTAALINDRFVPIKVDREERPDVDAVYMEATQAMVGRGGWPMTVFADADGRPFFCGTYFPPEPRGGQPGFTQVLDAVHQAWVDRRGDLLEQAERLTESLRRPVGPAGDDTSEVGRADIDEATMGLLSAFDADWGGFGRAPKFPHTMSLDHLLRQHHRTGSAAALGAVVTSLDAMAVGGIHDHLGGGFSRYSVDRQWLVPHFEKMLYDNALLARFYLHVFQVTGDEAFATIARETLDYLAREMLDPEGGFYSAQDADSEGIEGKFFVWTPDEIDAVLGADDGLAFRTLYHVTEGGNCADPHHPEFGRRNVLSRPRPLEAVARELGRDASDLAAALPEWRRRLYQAREQRVHPGLDDKVLTSWNGLALAAFAEGARVLDEPRYREVAVRNAAFLRERVWDGNRLLHTYKAGRARVDGLLEDYAYLAVGLVEAYRSTGDVGHLEWA